MLKDIRGKKIRRLPWMQRELQRAKKKSRDGKGEFQRSKKGPEKPFTSRNPGGWPYFCVQRGLSRKLGNQKNKK